jgi:putative ABC transport system permease protein
MALGARPADILRNALAESLPMIAAGILIGVGASLAASRLVAGFLFGVTSTDATAFAILPLVLALVAMAACYIPARRAAKTDPLVAYDSSSPRTIA